jgi:phosphoglycerate dehydrogenase-like enzyme
MPPHTILVLGNPAARHLALLDRLPGSDTRVLTGESVDVFLHAAGEADVVLLAGNYTVLLRALWPELHQLQWVHSMAAGLESTLFPELVESPVILTNGRGVFARSLGEFAMAGMLHFAKHLSRMKAQQANRRWEVFDIEELHGHTLGIVGYGAIGRVAAERARAFGMRILALRRHPEKCLDDPLVDRAYAPDQLIELIAESDYILAAAPLTPETRGLIGAAEFAAMKPGAVLINLGRGPVVVEDQLVRALREHRIRGAVLDVFDEEPLPAGHPLWNLDNVLLSPHTADHTSTWLQEAVELFLENYRRFATGEPLLNVTDKQLGY